MSATAYRGSVWEGRPAERRRTRADDHGRSAGYLTRTNNHERRRPRNDHGITHSYGVSTSSTRLPRSPYGGDVRSSDADSNGSDEGVDEANQTRHETLNEAVEGVTPDSGSLVSEVPATIDGKLGDEGHSGRLVPSSEATVSEATYSAILRHRAFRFDALRSQLDLAEQVRKAIQPFTASLLLEQFRAADFLVPQGLRMAELAGTARIAELIGPNSALACWRQSLLTKQTAIALAASSRLRFEPIGAALLSDLTRMSSVGASLAELATNLSAAGAFASVFSKRPALQLHEYLDRLPEPPSIYQLSLGVRASHGVAGLVGIEVATTAADDAVAFGEAVEQIEDAVVSPWLNGPAATRNEMIGRLRQIDESVPELLDGAWDDVMRAGPAATAKVATCVVEALERTLRALAPDAAVMAWHAENRRPSSELDERGRPTYGTRARYILRDHGSQQKLVVSQVEAVVEQVPELRSRLQAAKHASSGSLVALKAHLVSTEAVLVQLTLED